MALLITKGNRAAFGSGPGGPTDPVNVRLGFFGEVVVDHQIDAFDIDATGGDVGGDKNAGPAGAEILQGALAGSLGFVAVDGVSGHSGFGELFRQAIGSVLGAAENQREAFLAAFQQVVEQRPLVGHADVADRLVDFFHRGGGRGHFDMLGIFQDAPGEVDDRLRHGGGEEKGLPFRGKQGDDAPHIMDETHVEHAVGFIDDEDFELAEIHLALLEQIEEPTGGGHDNFRPALQGLDLGILSHPAEHHGGLEGEIGPVGFEAGLDLRGQFPRWGEDEDSGAHPHPFTGMLGEVLEDGQREGRGLAGAGLGAAHHIMPLEDEVDGLLLDGGGDGVVAVPEGALDGFTEGETVEGYGHGRNIFG